MKAQKISGYLSLFQLSQFFCWVMWSVNRALNAILMAAMSLSRAPITPGSVRINPVIVGVAYAACLIAWKGSLNPARALGSAFVSQNAGKTFS